MLYIDRLRTCGSYIPHCDSVHVVDVRIQEATITVWVESTRAQVPCPVCSVPTGSVHCTYRRTVQDLPSGSYVVNLVVTVRCFQCRNDSCPRKFFSEQIPNLTARYQRRTPRADQRVVELAIEYTDQGCERLGPLLGLR
ncbi:transposase family protein [Alicyclobacillus acidocaldarius]|uniref:transposase family protein n=1 Tax=Alicyclobacillus acidocaldarius TaxID=405212 RepID=UPI0035BE39DB